LLAAFDSVTNVYEVGTHKLIFRVGIKTLLEKVFFSHDGKQIIATSKYTITKIWNAGDGKIYGSIKGACIGLSQDNLNLISTRGEFYELNGQLLKSKSIFGNTSYTNAIQISEDGESLIMGSSIYQTANGSLIDSIKIGVYVAFLPDKRIAMYKKDTVAIIKTTPRQTVQYFSGVNFPVFNRDGTIFVTMKDGMAKVWDVSLKKMMSEFQSETIKYRSDLEISGDGRFIASVNQNNKNNVNVWDTSSGKLIWSLNNATNIRSIKFSQDGKYFGVGDDGATGPISSVSRQLVVGDLLQRMGLRTVPLETLSIDAASRARSDPIATVFRDYPGRVIAGMICFFAFFSIALGLGAWLPNILAERGFTIAKSLNSIFWMTLAFPCASAFMMYALERFGRKPTAVVAFILTGVFAILFGNAVDETMVLAIGFCMIFFTQLSGNASQIFISEVFPTNARATGFGLAQAAGRAGAAIAILAIPLIQNVWSTTAVFAAIAVIVAIAAVAVTQVGPEARGLALDGVAPPTA